MKSDDNKFDFDQLDLSALSALVPMFEQMFGGAPREKSPYENLGNGYELRPIELKNKKGEVVENRLKYSHLYRDGKKISDNIFRKSGSSMGFRDGYCLLIHYIRENKNQKEEFSFGNSVIIDEAGEIVLGGTSSISYPSHCGGIVGKLDGIYYNLLTREAILKTSSSSSISSKNYIIIEHRYGWIDKNLPLGVYMINKKSGECQKIDDIK